MLIPEMRLLEGLAWCTVSWGWYMGLGDLRVEAAPVRQVQGTAWAGKLGGPRFMCS